MHTVHHTRIVAPLHVVFAIARDVESWPDLLPQYRWCRVLERGPERLTFSMGGWIRGWPARWTAVQELRPGEHRITFRHIQGITAGMQAEWRFTSAGGGVDVELVHEFVMRWPLIGRAVGDLIVGPVFIDWIARKTLQAVKRRAEATADSMKTGGARA